MFRGWSHARIVPVPRVRAYKRSDEAIRFLVPSDPLDPSQRSPFFFITSSQAFLSRLDRSTNNRLCFVLLFFLYRYSFEETICINFCFNSSPDRLLALHTRPMILLVDNPVEGCCLAEKGLHAYLVYLVKRSNSTSRSALERVERHRREASSRSCENTSIHRRDTLFIDATSSAYWLSRLSSRDKCHTRLKYAAKEARGCYETSTPVTAD